MKFGVRVKFLLLFVLIALVPLVISLYFIASSARGLRTKEYGNTIEAMASTNALALQIVVSKDIEELSHLIQHDNEIVSACEAKPERLKIDQLEKNDDKIRKLPDDDPWIKKLIAGKLARRLLWIVEKNPSVREILLTDRFGQLLAATQRPSDFFQGDEKWWIKTWDDGKGKVFIADIYFDLSVKAWSLAFCLPIAADDGKIVGVAKVVIDFVTWANNLKWLSSDYRDEPVKGMEISRMVVSCENGSIIFRSDQTGDSEKYVPMSERMADWADLKIQSESGWRVTKNRRLQGYAPVDLSSVRAEWKVDAPRWSVVLDMPEAQALSEIRTVSFIIFTGGLFVILVIFLVGWGLAEHGIIRRIRKLKWAAKTVAEGDLSYRVEDFSISSKFLGGDELDELAGNFNRMVNRVEKSHEMLTRSNELKTHFIQIAGHELRTPLTYIMAMLNLLQKSEDAAPIAKAIKTMSEKAKSLEAIIGSMFKLMEHQGRLTELRYETIDVQMLLERIYEECEPFAAKRHQRLIIEQAEKIPTIRADRGKLCDVIINLVMNAIKFTPDGKTVRVQTSEQLGGFIAIAVRDEGTGIPAEDLPNVFDPFFSTADVMKHSSGEIGYQKRGMGLGLAIVRHFIEMHGGSVHVTTSSKGSVFTVTIPIEPKAEH